MSFRDKNFLILLSSCKDNEPERHILLMWVQRVRVESRVMPRSLTSFTGSIIAVPTLRCEMLSLGIIIARVEVNDFSLSWVAFKSVLSVPT